MKTAHGKLVIIDGNKVFWNGKQVDATEIVLHADDEGVRFRLRVAGGMAAIYNEMAAAGIKVRVGA